METLNHLTPEQLELQAKQLLNEQLKQQLQPGDQPIHEALLNPVYHQAFAQAFVSASLKTPGVQTISEPLQRYLSQSVLAPQVQQFNAKVAAALAAQAQTPAQLAQQLLAPDVLAIDEDDPKLAASEASDEAVGDMTEATAAETDNQSVAEIKQQTAAESDLSEREPVAESSSVETQQHKATSQSETAAVAEHPAQTENSSSTGQRASQTDSSAQTQKNTAQGTTTQAGSTPAAESTSSASPVTEAPQQAQVTTAPENRGQTINQIKSGEMETGSPLANQALAALGGAMQELENAGTALGKVTGALGLASAGSPSVKHFDPVMGVDVHLLDCPQPTPIPAPYIAMVFDSGEYMAEAAQACSAVGLGGVAKVAGMLGGSIYINQFHKGMASSEMKNMPHTPWHNPGTFNEGEIFMGSSSVLTEGEPFSYQALPGLDCSMVGIPTPGRGDKPKKTLAMVLPTSMQLPLPQPMPVIVGGAPTISMTALAMKGVMKGAGAIGKKVAKKAGGAGKKLGAAVKKWQKKSRVWKAISGKCHKAADKVFDQKLLKKCDNFREGVHNAICTLTGHPIDVIAGYVTTEQQTDISLPGPMPFVWQRCYYSDSSYQGQLGYGWHHSYDYALLDNHTDYLLIQLPDGRACGTLRPKPGKPSLMPDIRMHLCVDKQGTYYLQDYYGTQYYFAQGSFYDEENSGRRFPLSCIQDSHHNQIRFCYHEHNGHLYAIFDSAGRRLNVSTDKYGRVTGIGLDDGRNSHPLVSYVYQDLDLVQVLDAKHQPFSYQYQNHLLVKETNRVGTTYHFRWDDVSKGVKARAIATWGRSESYPEPFYVRELHYDDDKRITTVTDGRETSMVYHWHPVLPVVSQEVDPLGHSTRYTFDDYHNLIGTTDAMGYRTASEYDIANRLISETDAKGNQTEYIYPEPGEDALIDGRVIEIHQGKSTTIFSYNPQGAMICRKSDSEWIELDYHTTGQLQSAVNKTAGIQLLKYDYDEHGLLRTVYDSDNQPTRYEYNLSGLVTKVSSACFGETVLQYDACGNLTERQHQSMAAEQFVYNAEGQVSRYQDASGAVTELDYQGLPFICCRTHADGHELHYEYDSELNLTALVNENRERYELHYDEKERLIQEKAFDGSTVSYQYAPNDFLTRRQEGELGWQQHIRDPLGRLEKILYQDGDCSQFSYDEQGRLTEAGNNHHITQFEYNDQHQLTAQIQDGQRIAYETQPTHHSLTLPNGQCLTYHISAGHKLSHISIDGNVLSRYDYDEKGFEIKQSLGAMTLLQSYDPYGRLIEQRGEHAHQPQPLTRRGYAYDKAGRVAQIQRQFGGLQTFDYDNRGRLQQTTTGEQHQQYRFDAAGNLFHDDPAADNGRQPVYTLHFNSGKTDGAASYVRHNQLTRNGERHCQYDEYGNRILESYGNGTSQTRYFYNTQNQLTVLQKTVASHTTLVMNFTYDALGRRCAKFVTEYHNNQPVRQTRTSFLWDGDVLLAEQQSETDLLQGEELPPVSFAQPDVVYIHRPNSFEPLMQLRPPAAEDLPEDDILPPPQFSVYYYLNDHLGTPQELLDKRGNIVWQALTSPYGMLEKLKENKVSNPIRLPGQYADEESGLHYNRFRYYHPQDGCYLNRDPIGLLGGLNLYDYPRDPVNWGDPLGLAKLFELGTYGSLNGGSNVGDGLQAHEMIRHEFLKQQGLAGESRLSGNPSIALDLDHHTRGIGKDTRKIGGVHFHEQQIRAEKGLGPNDFLPTIKGELDITSEAMRRTGIPEDKISLLRKDAVEFYNDRVEVSKKKLKC
ncbi:RHS repeat-associated core domain-containing protein [Vibrio quintilis]|uniref:Putative deoxyribonuclease RhsC n=1 Tax=Vibrio quintilis TaxID=1117707 RepID=A0A1M7YQ40_9VIBR|nr:RHS repeat-associated core domain-containing protein [Vibrio quintilis]SHO54704.1 Putative deoxyribonuclease RhsC [Vibrio quintilis]